MRDFVATFYTHLSAMLTCRAMQAAGFSARMAPVPRALSSSCGTCVFYAAPEPREDLLDQDTERVYEVQNGAYALVWNQEET